MNLVATDTHFIAAWLKDVVGADADFVKDKHFFKKVALPQTGDIGWWHNGKAGHVVIYDLDAGETPRGLRGNVWTATTAGGDPFAPGLIKWFDDRYNAPAKWFRYWKLELAK